MQTKPHMPAAVSSRPDLSADVVALIDEKFPMVIGTLNAPTKLEGTFYVSRAGTISASGNHATFMLREEGAADSPHRFAIMCAPEITFARDVLDEDGLPTGEVEQALLYPKGDRYVNPTFGRAVYNDNGTFRDIPPAYKEISEDGRTWSAVYHSVYLVSADQLIEVGSVRPLEVASNLKRATAARKS